MTSVLFPVILLIAASGRPDLEGRVITKGGEPVAGAHVLIRTAAVRQGTSPLCPSCYADCKKSGQTDKQGRFRISSLDPELLFNVLVVADGFQPTFAKKRARRGRPPDPRRRRRHDHGRRRSPRDPGPPDQGPRPPVGWEAAATEDPPADQPGKRLGLATRRPRAGWPVRNQWPITVRSETHDPRCDQGNPGP